MDIKAKITEISERCEKDEAFRQLMKDDFVAAMKSCGVSSIDEFAKALNESSLMSDQEMSAVSGGNEDAGSYRSGNSYFNSAYNDWYSSYYGYGSGRGGC